MRFLFIFCLLFIYSVKAAAQFECLDEIITPVSIDVKNKDFSDLESLKKSIAKSNIVLLGENHGDGSVYQMKVRLIQFLQQKMGFNTIVFESGMYDCYKAWELVNKKEMTVDSFFSSAILPEWSASREIEPLTDFIQERKEMKVYGFDCQVTSANKDYIAKDVKSTLNAYVPHSQQQQIQEAVTQIFTDPLLRKTTDSLKLLKSYSQLDSLIVKFLKNTKVRTLKEKALYNTIAFLRVFTNEESRSSKSFSKVYNNLRDSLMADNILWMTQNTLKNKKVVVWAATRHIARQLPNDSYKTMGEYLKSKYTTGLYSIGFISSEGKRRFYNTPKAVGFKVADTSSIEAYLSSKGRDVFFDFKEGQKKHNCLYDQNFKAGFFGYLPREANWSKLLDGVIYIKYNEPSTPGIH